MSDENFEILNWVSVADWPFGYTSLQQLEDGIEKANTLAPGNTDWVYSLKGDEGFYLVRYYEEAPGDGGDA